MKESPLKELHAQLGAEMYNESGWLMPKKYTNLVDEHMAARASCGIFDVSHLSKFRIQGKRAAEWLDKIFSNSVETLHDGQSQQTLMLNRQGVIIDKVTLARETEERFFIVGSASQESTNDAWLRINLFPEGVQILNQTDAWCAISTQGPDSQLVFERILPRLHFPLFSSFERSMLPGKEIIISRSGADDEHGFELYCPAHDGIYWFEQLMAAGAIPCGAQARECLRLERGQFYINKHNLAITPDEAGLKSLCSPDKEYTGSIAVNTAEDCLQRLTPIRCIEESIPLSPGDTVEDAEGNEIGLITGAAQSPALNHGIAVALLDTAFTTPGTELIIRANGKAIPAVVSDGE